jgi:hypothetical protein
LIFITIRTNLLQEQFTPLIHYNNAREAMKYFRDVFFQCLTINIFIIGLFFSSNVSLSRAGFGPQSSTKNVDWDFDFVETFEGLENWRPNPLGGEGNVGEEPEDPAKMPQLTGGGIGAWEYYSIWSDATPPQDWIGKRDGSGSKHEAWRGEKSLAIDIGGSGKGPSRFGLYNIPGYNDFYLFFMVNIPKNEWPTSCEGGSCKASSVGNYTEGQPYTWYSSWKFLTFNYGCGYKNCWEAGKGYSPLWHQITHLKQYNYGTAPGVTFHAEDPGHSSDVWALDSGRNLDSYGPNALGFIGDWFGVEYHISISDSATTHEIWVYDQNGNSYKMLEPTNWNTDVAAKGKPMDFFFFGGNNSGTYSWGSSMESVYYIDDVIFDDQPIGKKYFNLIKSGLPPTVPYLLLLH